MRVMFRLVFVAVLLGLAAAPAAADPAPPKVDVAAALAALGSQQVYVAPGSPARADMAAVGKALSPDTKLMFTPYRQGYADTDDNDEYLDKVYEPVKKWAEDHKVHLIMIEGIEASLVGFVDAGPTTVSDLREQTAYLDVTGPILALVAYIENPKIGEVPAPAY